MRNAKDFPSGKLSSTNARMASYKKKLTKKVADRPDGQAFLLHPYLQWPEPPLSRRIQNKKKCVKSFKNIGLNRMINQDG